MRTNVYRNQGNLVIVALLSTLIDSDKLDVAGWKPWVAQNDHFPNIFRKPIDFLQAGSLVKRIVPDQLAEAKGYVPLVELSSQRGRRTDGSTAQLTSAIKSFHSSPEFQSSNHCLISAYSSKI
jgi:hypothetical protein